MGGAHRYFTVLVFHHRRCPQLLLLASPSSPGAHTPKLQPRDAQAELQRATTSSCAGEIMRQVRKNCPSMSLGLEIQVTCAQRGRITKKEVISLSSWKDEPSGSTGVSLDNLSGPKETLTVGVCIRRGA